MSNIPPRDGSSWEYISREYKITWEEYCSHHPESAIYAVTEGDSPSRGIDRAVAEKKVVVLVRGPTTYVRQMGYVRRYYLDRPIKHELMYDKTASALFGGECYDMTETPVAPEDVPSNSE